MTVNPWPVFSSNFGEMPMPYTAFVTILTVGIYLILSFNVGRARMKHKVPAPAMDGPEEFMRVFRVQMNTLEQLAFHLPLMWIAAFAMDDVFAASLGCVWLFGRILYARGYYAKAKRRNKGFMIAMITDFILMAGALSGTLASF